MAAPTYTWEFVCDLMGDRVPKVITLEAASGLYTKIGTLCSMSSGQVAATTDGTGYLIIGIAQEVIDNATATDPVKIAVLAPGMVIKGTSATSAAAYSGFISKTYDLNSTGDIDCGDTTNGGLSVWRTEDAGLTVYCVVGASALY